jgi:hypothetical protein
METQVYGIIYGLFFPNGCYNNKMEMELTTSSSSEIDIITYTNNTINKIIVLFIATIFIIVLINYYLFLHFIYNKQQKNNNTNNIIHNNIHSSIIDIREKIQYLERFVTKGQCDQLESVHDIQRILTERSNNFTLFEITLTNLLSEMDEFQRKIQSLINCSNKIEHIETTLSNMRSDMTDIDNKTTEDFNKINTIICEQNGKKNDDIQDKLNELNSKNEQIQTILKSNIINLIELQTNLDNNIVKRIEKNTNSIEQLQNNDDIKNIKMDMVTLTSQMNTIDSSSNKNIDLLREQIQNSSSGFTMIPIPIPIPLKSGSRYSYCDINCETLLFCGNYASSDPFNTNLTGVKLCVGDKNHILLEDLNTTDLHVFKFLEQFRKIKSIYFEIGGTKTNYIAQGCHTTNILVQLFHHLIKMNPHMDIYFKCKDIWHDPFNNPSEILTELTKTTNYASFHLEIENNFVKDAQTGNMRLVSSVVSNKIKEHCVNYNINFVSNIGTTLYTTLPPPP